MVGKNHWWVQKKVVSLSFPWPLTQLLYSLIVISFLLYASELELATWNYLYVINFVIGFQSFDFSYEWNRLLLGSEKNYKDIFNSFWNPLELLLRGSGPRDLVFQDIDIFSVYLVRKNDICLFVEIVRLSKCQREHQRQVQCNNLIFLSVTS